MSALDPTVSYKTLRLNPSCATLSHSEWPSGGRAVHVEIWSMPYPFIPLAAILEMNSLCRQR